MDKKTAELIVEASLVIGGMDVELYEEYSGRSMYGESTTGVTASHGEMLACVAQAAADLAREDQEDYDVDTFVEDVSNVRTDSLGRSIVWY